MNRLLFFTATAILLSSFQHSAKRKVILAIFAHPDDELAIAPAISKLSKEYRIQVVYATDGKGGTRVKEIPPDSLAITRQAEVTCSLQQLGAEPPIFLHLERLDSKNGLSPFWKETKWAKDSLKNIISRINPDVIITIGPDGDTGHPEHRVIGALSTELLLREGWVERYPLWFFVWTKAQADRYEKMDIDELMYADPRYINLAVKYSDADEAASWNAMKCHESQYTPEEFEKTIKMDKADSSNTLYFRKFVVQKGRQTHF